MIFQKIIAVIFLLFAICFIAIIIEESFLGGRRRRKLEHQRRKEVEDEIIASQIRKGSADAPDTSY